MANDVTDALKWFDELNGGTPHLENFNKTADRKKKPEAAYKILSDKPIYSDALFQYLDLRQIPHELAKQHLRQVYFLHRGSGKRIFGLGFKTRAGGYDIRNPYGFKTMIGSKDISFIPGEQHGNRIEIIEGAFDFLSKLYLENRSKPLYDTIITNSVNLSKQAADLVKQGNYSEAILWPDNDKAGWQFIETFKGEFVENRPMIFSMNNLYDGYKDLNKWHTDSPMPLKEKQQLIKAPTRISKTLIKSENLNRHRHI